MINAKFFIGFPEDYKGICYVYPPTVKEVIGNPKFSIYRSILMISNEDIEDRIIEKEGDITKDTYVPSPFDYVMSLAYQGGETRQLVMDSFYFFIHEPVTFLFQEKKIIIGDLKENLNLVKNVEDLRILTEEDFFDFQNLLRAAVGEKDAKPPVPNEHPKVKKMKAKARYRDRVKAKQEGITLGTSLTAICCMGIGINPLNIREISYCAIGYLTRMYQDKEKYQIDIDSLLAGAKASDVKLKYWIREDKD